jgi:hypothetical protein
VPAVVEVDSPVPASSDAAREPPQVIPPSGARRNIFAGPERKRLLASVEVARAQLRASASAAPEGNLEIVRSLLERAGHEAAAGNLDSGWQFLHEARRLHLWHLPADVLDASRVSLRCEAKAKLTSWRREAVQDLLDGLTDDASIDTKRVVLCEAMQVRDEHSDNVYFRNRLLRLQMSVVAGTMFVFALSFVMLVNQYGRMLGEALANKELDVKTVVASMLLGGMAACLSALITFATSSTELRIPAHLANVSITVTRPLIGAVSGLVALLMLTSGVLNMPDKVTPWIAPFLFGFSERLVVGALNKQ